MSSGYEISYNRDENGFLNVRMGIDGFGFFGRKDDTFYLIRCPDCGKENYSPMKPSGQCAWCGHKPKVDPNAA